MQRAALVAALLLAGCSSSGSSSSSDDGFGDVDTGVSSTSGAIRGVVVDPAIQPLTGVDVVARANGLNRTVASDAQGRFVFAGLQPGTYLLAFHHLLYHPAQTTVEVVAGIEPQVTRVQLEPVFSKTPYHQQQKFTGYIFCGHADVVASPCIFDYTQLACAGGCEPTLHEILLNAQGDTRYFLTTVGPDWQTEQVEMTFKDPEAGVSRSMSLGYSFYGRTSSDRMGSVVGASPLLLRMETGVEHETAGGSRPMINASGDDDLYIFVNVAADDGMFVGLAINQKMELFQTTFYNAKPPTGWSFLAGDKFPF